MARHSAFAQHPSKVRCDLDKIFPLARGKTAKTKIFCNSIPAIVGPWRGTIRAWHAASEAARGQELCVDHPLPGATVPLDDATALFMAPAQTIPQLRAALRRERQLGIAGHPSYSVARHGRLRAAMKAAAGALAKDPWLALNAKKRSARVIIEQRAVAPRIGKRPAPSVWH